MRSPVPVEELQRAWSAVQAGEFRTNNSSRRRGVSTWTPTEPTIVVAGAAGRVGASTVAVSMATACDRSVRVVESGPMHTTGLAAATTAELGVTDTGWRRGTRDRVLIERTTSAFDRVDDVPTPEGSDCELTIVDASWDLNQVIRADSWLTSLISDAPMLIVTVATVPGLRALDTALQMTARPHDTWCAVLGPSLKKWPKALRTAANPRVQTAIDTGRLTTIPTVPTLAMTGLTTDPLPPHLVTACTPVLGQLVEHTKGNHHAELR